MTEQTVTLHVTEDQRSLILFALEKAAELSVRNAEECAAMRPGTAMEKIFYDQNNKIVALIHSLT